LLEKNPRNQLLPEIFYPCIFSLSCGLVIDFHRNIMKKKNKIPYLLMLKERKNCNNLLLTMSSAGGMLYYKINSLVHTCRFYCLEHLMGWPGVLVHFYYNLELGERLFVLEVAREVLSRGTHMPCDAVQLLAAEFKQRADAIFMALGSPNSTPEPTESAALLETIATASGLGDSQAALELKQDASLLTSAVCKYN
jgi:hypothetical protein